MLSASPMESSPSSAFSTPGSSSNDWLVTQSCTFSAGVLGLSDPSSDSPWDRVAAVSASGIIPAMVYSCGFFVITGEPVLMGASTGVDGVVSSTFFLCINAEVFVSRSVNSISSPTFISFLPTRSVDGHEFEGLLEVPLLVDVSLLLVFRSKICVIGELVFG